MCRMVFIQKDVPNQNLIALYTLLTAAADDRGQRDGWGIAIGTNVIAKGAEPFSYAPRHWIYEISAYTGNLIGHIRAASSHTTKRVIDAHPYIFKNQHDRIFVFCHNGTFNLHFPYGAVKDDTPHTDTWVAITDLLKDVRSLTASHINKWVKEETGIDDAFVVLINDDEGNTHIIRGDKRDFYLAETPYGIIGVTSKPSLYAAQDLMQTLHQIQIPINQVKEIPPYTYVRIGIGNDIEVEHLTPPSRRQWLLFPQPATTTTPPEKAVEVLSGGDLERYFSTLIHYYPIRPITLRIICAMDRYGSGWGGKINSIPSPREIIKYFPIMSALEGEMPRKRRLALLWNNSIPADQEVDFIKSVLDEIYGGSVREFLKDFPVIASSTEGEAEAMIETWKVLLKGGKK